MEQAEAGAKNQMLVQWLSGTNSPEVR